MVSLLIKTLEESNAVEKIFLTHYHRMYCLAFSILKSESDAEDAVMNTFVYISKYPEKFIDYTSIETKGLISLCTKTAAIDIYRKNKRLSKTLSFDEDTVEPELIDFSNLSDSIITEDNCKIITNEIRNLDMEYQVLIALKYFYHWKTIEIADFMKTTPATISKRIQKAKVLLAISLRKKGVSF